MFTAPCGRKSPPFEKGADNSDSSRAPTARMDGLLAGSEAGCIVPGRALSLPAAAMVSVPSRSPTCATCSYAGLNLFSSSRIVLPSDMLMTWHPLAIAHCMPAIIPAVAPLPWLLNTLPAKISQLVAQP